MELIPIIWIGGIAAILFALYLAWDVLRRDQGTPEMQRIAGMIYQGAMAFLRRQYQTIAVLAVVAAVLVGSLVGVLGNNAELGLRTAIAFLVGAACSALSGFIGMYVAVRSNLRTAAAARHSLSDALHISLSGGAVSGFMVVALSLLGVSTLFFLYGGAAHPELAPSSIVGFGFGASFVALFAQLGGGIYTKAADVGADLVGKVEAGIPEDDPRNPAVIADLVGDNVGDCAGRGADLFESTAAENIGAMILGVSLYAVTGSPVWILFPLIILAVGILASIVGLISVRFIRTRDPMNALNIGYGITCLLSAIGLFFVVQNTLHSTWFFLAGMVGLVASIIFVYITQYYTAGTWRPVREIADASKTGPATNIIAGLAVGFENPAAYVITISGALLLSFWLGQQATVDIPVQAGKTAIDPYVGGIFGTAVATMGMLVTCAYILAMDTFGPITDNAGGITEMSGAPEEVRHITDALDSVGNTTKALTKGYAVGSAALAAFLLFSAYLDEVARFRGVQEGAKVVNLADVRVFVGAFLGAMLVYLFSSLAIRAVGRAAGKMIQEVRRQFRADPGIMKGTSQPDFARCVDIATRGALREMVAPGLLAVCAPIAVGIILGDRAAAGMLMVGTMAGMILATFMNNGGGAWDNAKKFIEAGFLKDEAGKTLGKRTDAHAASVVGDTVGDPFKDTAGPSLHVLIKLLSTITLVLAPLFLR